MGMDMVSDSSGPQRDETVPKVDAKGTYDRFMAITKWAVILVALALIMMALFLA
ncbi:aa3-type cytochrome c oxidase subunit IV [Polymorphobacter sp.]|uniref:aa3-type cytochrome c oxidase subunit IV n=1 Tax=Polymorphobacter sp. TaxID=1909290 RepID=UPI003F6E903E